MKVKMKKIIVAIVVLVCTMNVKAQEESGVDFSVNADIVSSYVWRGLYQGGGASIQPGLSLSVNGFSIGAWGSSNFSGGNKEVDFTVGYEIAGLSLAVTDYWWEGEGAFNYFKYEDAHHFEASLGYTLPTESFPLSLSWNTMFAGADTKADGKRASSTYISATYPFSIKSVGLEAAIGITPWEGIYAEKFAVTNISLKASKEIKITDSFSLPVFGQVIINPNSEGIYFVFGVSL
jgi:uncharacterized protein (TIGR02001 family)